MFLYILQIPAITTKASNVFHIDSLQWYIRQVGGSSVHSPLLVQVMFRLPGHTVASSTVQV